MISICVFCGARPGQDPEFQAAALSLGKLLAENNITLIYGGGIVGLMGSVADGVLNAGGKVIGVIPDFLVKREMAHPDLTELHIVHSMHERKAKMAALASGFIALPGGFGTLEELFEIATWAQLDLHQKPIGLLNVNQFYTPLLDFVDHMANQGFVSPTHRELLITDNEPRELLIKVVKRFDILNEPASEQDLLDAT